jgi:hypothetical protein
LIDIQRFQKLEDVEQPNYWVWDDLTQKNLKKQRNEVRTVTPVFLIPHSNPKLEIVLQQVVAQ